MFTGIIQSIGEVAAIEAKGDDTRLRILTNKLDLGDVQLGDSIAVNGVCLTAVELPGDGFFSRLMIWQSILLKRALFVLMVLVERVML